MDLWPLQEAFTEPGNSVADAARLVVIAAGAVMLFLIAVSAYVFRATGQPGKYALLCFGVTAIAQETQDLSLPAGPSLVIDAVGVGFGLVFLWRSRVRGVVDETKIVSIDDVDELASHHEVGDDGENGRASETEHHGEHGEST